MVVELTDALDAVFLYFTILQVSDYIPPKNEQQQVSKCLPVSLGTYRAGKDSLGLAPHGHSGRNASFGRAGTAARGDHGRHFG